MQEALIFLLAPTVMCLLLAGIHCYLGLHVLARGVIFIDLSLAQIAALGASIAIAFGFEHNSSQAYFASLFATLVAAWFFAIAKEFEHRFSQEAIIGIIYALGSAAVVLVVDRLAHGAEHIKEILVGQILWVTWSDVVKTALIYSFVGFIHFVFRKQFVAVSFTKNHGLSYKWDFFFYALFGIVITSSVSVAGVLQVFAFLIVPSVLSSLFFQSLKAKLIFGWVFGVFISFIGMLGSYYLDFPSGAFLVVCFTIIPVFILLVKKIYSVFCS